MKKVPLISILFVIAMVGCTIHFPIDYWEDADQQVRVVLRVVPDDADILLDGKFIGMAYEFASPRSAVLLGSKNHQLVIRRDGYQEEEVDLRGYGTNDITVRLTMMTGSRRSFPRYGEAATKTPTPEEAKPVPTPGTVEEKKVPEPPEPQGSEELKMVNVTLKILPDDSSIYLDGKFWGIAPVGGVIENLRLEEKEYTLEVLKPGYQTVKRTFKASGEKMEISISLVKK